MKDEKRAKAKDEGRMVFIHPSHLHLRTVQVSFILHPWFSAASIALNIALALFTDS